MRRALADMGQQKMALAGLVILAVLALAAALAPWLAPHDPRALSGAMLPPSPQHPLGTDDVGHDILSDLLYGARFSLLVGFLSAGLSSLIGLLLGTVAGYYDRLGFAIMRIVDIFLAIPRFPLIIVTAAFLRPGFWTLVLIFVLFGWMGMARLVRSWALSERSSGYIESARAIGARDARILGRHLLPGSVPVALVRFVGEFQHVILAESGLSFLGMSDPTTKSWGMMMHYAFEYPTIFISDVWVRWMLPPGLCITLAVLSLALLGFAFEVRVHPHLNVSRAPRRVAADATAVAPVVPSRAEAKPESGLP